MINKNIKFESNVYLSGHWNKENSSVLDDIAYYLYLKDVKDLQSVLIQSIFKDEQKSEKYYTEAQLLIRRKKLERIRK